MEAKCVSCEETVKDEEELYGEEENRGYKYYSGECENCEGTEWLNSSSNVFVPVDSDYWDIEVIEFVNADREEMLSDEFPEITYDSRCPSCGGRVFEYMAPSAGKMCIFCSYTH